MNRILRSKWTLAIAGILTFAGCESKKIARTDELTEIRAQLAALQSSNALLQAALATVPVQPAAALQSSNVLLQAAALSVNAGPIPNFDPPPGFGRRDYIVPELFGSNGTILAHHARLRNQSGTYFSFDSDEGFKSFVLDELDTLSLLALGLDAGVIKHGVVRETQHAIARSKLIEWQTRVGAEQAVSYRNVTEANAATQQAEAASQRAIAANKQADADRIAALASERNAAANEEIARQSGLPQQIQVYKQVDVFHHKDPNR